MRPTRSQDLTGDGLVDLADRDEWLSAAGEVNLGPGLTYLLGDANLDGVVDVTDFNRWNTNKFLPVAAYCEGDLNADGVVDVSDFNLWNQNKFSMSSDGLAVPQPASGLLLLAAWGLLIAQWRAVAHGH